MSSQLEPIQSLWIGDCLSNMELLCLRSYLYQGHAFHLYTYNHLDNLPMGVQQMDANEILPYSNIFKYRNRDTYAGFADLFRYKLLLDKGGYWSDMDVICIRPLNFESDYVFATEWNNEIANCFIRSPAGSDLMQKCYDKAMQLDPENTYWGQAGPVFFREIINTLNLKQKPLEVDAFCSIPYDDYNVFTQAGSAELLETRLRNAYGIHLWNEMWRLNNVDKNKIYSSTSIYRTLQEKFSI